MLNFIKYVTLTEAKEPKTLTQTPLPYKRDELEPVKSEETLNYHYGELYGGYVKRYNKGEVILSSMKRVLFCMTSILHSFRHLKVVIYPQAKAWH